MLTVLTSADVRFRPSDFEMGKSLQITLSYNPLNSLSLVIAPREELSSFMYVLGSYIEWVETSLWVLLSLIA